MRSTNRREPPLSNSVPRTIELVGLITCPITATLSTARAGTHRQRVNVATSITLTAAGHTSTIANRTLTHHASSR